PAFMRFQLRSRVCEAKTNLHSIRVAELSLVSSAGTFLPAVASPVPDGGVLPHKQPWVDNGGFAAVGWEPEGEPYFNYKIVAEPGGCPAPGSPCDSFTAEAASDLDGDGALNFWGYVHPNRSGSAPNASLCQGSGVYDTRAGTMTALNQVGPCDLNMGTAI